MITFFNLVFTGVRQRALESALARLLDHTSSKYSRLKKKQFIRLALKDAKILFHGKNH